MIYKLLLLCVGILVITPISGQTLLKDIEDLPDSGSSPGNWSVVTDGVFIFEALNTLESQFLFASDGTEEGTIGLGTYQVDTDIIRFGDKAYFGGCNLLFGADSCATLYTSDGTVDGTVLFFDPTPGGVSLGISDIVAGSSLFYFAAHTIEHGYELYRSDGTINGTYEIMDVAPGMASGYAGQLAVIDDVAYFAGYTVDAGIEPWRSDGTITGTYMITDLNVGTADGFPSEFTASGGYIYFAGLGTSSGFEVRRTNGDQGNVELIGEMGTTDSSTPRGFVDSDGRLYYAAEGNDAAGYDLFVYDHVGAPVHLDLAVGDIFPRALMPFGDGEVIFNAVDGAGRELWRSDGTIAGTHRIIDLYPGAMDGVFGTGAVGESYYVCHDSLVYFAGADGVHASGDFVYELFVSDGTAAGTQLVSDHFPGNQGSNPGNFFEIDDRLYFAANDPVLGREPFYLEKGGLSSIVDNDKNLQITRAPFPNPVSPGESIEVNFILKSNTEIRAQIFDLLGRKLQGEQHLGYFSEGVNNTLVKIGNHPRGVYHLILKSENQQSGRLITIQQ